MYKGEYNKTMESLKIGDDVYWVQKTKTREIERVGKIIGVVQPECSPNRIFDCRDTVLYEISQPICLCVRFKCYILAYNIAFYLHQKKKYLLIPVPVTLHNSI